MTSARTKDLTCSPTNVGIEQEYWQSLSYLPSTAQAGSDKIKVRITEGKTQAMTKLGGSRYADLIEPEGVTPVYWLVTSQSPCPREGGWVILKLNCYKLCTPVQAARIMPCDNVLRFI